MYGVQTKAIWRLPPVAGIDLSITQEVILLWIAAGLTFALMMWVCRRRDLVAKGMLANAFEALIEFVEKEAARPLGKGWTSFLLTMFFFILFGNLLGMVPVPGYFKSATANINVTAGLALMVFGATVYAGIRRRGLVGFARQFVPSGISPWLAAVVAPLEFISWLMRPLSLAIRLFANMMAGHTLLFLLVALEVTSVWFLKPLPVIGAVAIGCFELFVCMIQAFVFTLLAGIYIREAMEEAR